MRAVVLAMLSPASENVRSVPTIGFVEHWSKGSILATGKRPASNQQATNA
jgi:hypothetical protein